MNTQAVAKFGWSSDLSVDGTVSREDIVRDLLINGPQLPISGLDESSAATLNEAIDDGSIVEFPITRKLPKYNSVPELKSTPFLVLQEWEGVVTRVDEDTFVASLLDVTLKKETEDEEAEFSVEELSMNDKRLLREGAIFRWIIGYRNIAGTKERSSKIVFRRLPAWNQQDIRRASEKAKVLSSIIDWE